MVLTGLEDDLVGLGAIRQGAQDYLVKEDVHPGVIRRVIHYAIERKHMLAMKDHFMNLVSHELRTPLVILKEIFLLISTGQLGAPNEQQKEFSVMGLSTVERMDRTTTNLLDLAKMESGKLVLKKSTFDFSELVKEIAVSFKYPVKQKGIELRFKSSVPTPLITADRDKIAQVLINLLHNAVKFTEQGWIEVALDEKETHVECRVADSGRGIHPEHLPKVFDKFEQFAESSHKGTGLGLSLCKEIMDLHEGKIWVEATAEQQGTLFVFTLPKG